MYIIVGLAVVAVGASVAAFVFDSKREKIKEENSLLEEEIKNYHKKTIELNNYSYERQREIIKEEFYILKAKLLNEIDLLYKEKLKIKEEIEEYLNLINREVESGKLNTFYLNENLRSKNLLIYGLEKVNAYFRYLRFFKNKIQKFEEKKQYHLIFELPKIFAYLPDDYLFKGKLVEVEINEFGEYNPYSQRLVLRKEDEKYLKDKNLVLIDEFDIYNKVFLGSISKGEVALFYDKQNFFEAVSIENEFGRIINLKYKNLELKLPKKEKEFNYKITKGEKLQVKVKYANYLLNNVIVTQKKEVCNYQLFVVGDFENLRIVEVNEEEIVFTDGNKKIIAKFKENYAEIVDIIEEKPKESFEIDVDIRFVSKEQFEIVSDFITKKEFKEVKDYLLLLYGAKTAKNEFFEKYIKLLDYQIEINQYSSYLLPYKVIDVSYERYTLKVDFNLDIEKNAYIEIGDKEYVLRDYEKGKFIQIDLVDEINKEGILVLNVYSYPYALIQQRKAINDFIFDNIANKTLKHILLNPESKRFNPLFENLEIDFKNKKLTPNQKEIVKKALNEKVLFLIQGPPGTGKTTVIKEIIYQTKKLNLAKNILIISQQNVAVDNVLAGIKRENIEKSILRIASNEGKVYEVLRNSIIEQKFKEYKEELKSNLDTGSYKIQGYKRYWYSLIKDKDFKEIDDFVKEYFIKNHKAIGATCVGLANERIGITQSEFDLVIIDEAGRATLGELMIPVLKAKKVILIGDHKQLPPSTDRKLIEKMEKDDGFNENDIKILQKSYFEELYEKLDSSSKAMLTEQFRMPNSIGNLISELFYEGKLKNGRDKEIKNALNWIDVKGYEEKQGTSKFNKKEAYIIKKMIEKFKDKQIAVITPYGAQKRVLRKVIGKIKNVKIDTIDSFQGEEADIVFYSLVRRKGNIQFLLDERRLNVAISRTREKLFFIGDVDFFAKDKFFRRIIKRCKKIKGKK